MRTVRNIEREDIAHPRWASLKLIADALGVPQHDLLRPAPAAAEATGSRRRPRQLPVAPADFAGRADVIEVARRLLADADAATVPGAVTVLNICGRPGVGKTTLAVVLGQLFVAMAGATRAPRSPPAILKELLMSLGIEANALPGTVTGRAALFREMSADRNLLVVLDDAGDEQHVLPPAPRHPVHRRRHQPASPRRAGRRTGGRPRRHAGTGVRRIVGAKCPDGADRPSPAPVPGLPLALRTAGARLASRPHLPVAALAADLDDERRRLDGLRFADLEVRSTLALACAALTADQRLGFALLGRLNVASVSSWTVASLFGVDHTRALQTLDVLVDARLVDAGPVDAFGEPRYRLHDPLRLFAGEMPVDDERWSAALLRVVGSWLALAGTADAVAYCSIWRRRRPRSAGTTRRGRTSTVSP